jgi:TonB family protein
MPVGGETAMNRISRAILLSSFLTAGILAAQEAPDHLSLARDAFKNGDYEKALESADAALMAEPDQATAQYIAGTALLRLGRLGEAEERLKALLELAPTFPGLQFQLGYLAFSRAENLMGQPGRSDDARELYASAAGHFAAELERNPEQPAIQSSRAIALGKAGKIDEALVAHDAWAAMEPESNLPLVSKGAFLAEAGREDEAAAILDRLPQPDSATVAAAALAYGTTLYEDERFERAIPLLGKALAHDPGSARAQGLLVASYARLGDLERTSAELTAYLALGPSEDEAAQVGEVIRTAFLNGTAPLPQGVQPPRVRKLGSVRYPKDQRDSRIRTEILVIVRVMKDGNPGSMDVVPNRIYREMREQGFEAAALEAVRRGKYEPGTRNGEPVDMSLLVPVVFEP